MSKNLVPILVFLLVFPVIISSQESTPSRISSPESATTTPIPIENGPESCCKGFVFDRNMDFCYFDMVDIKVRERGQYCADLNGVYDPKTRRCFKFPIIEDENPDDYPIKN